MALYQYFKGPSQLLNSKQQSNCFQINFNIIILYCKKALIIFQRTIKQRTRLFPKLGPESISDHTKEFFHHLMQEHSKNARGIIEK